jgi:superfamily II DNA/RNA helicase
MGFIPDIEEIFKRTPFTRQTLFFSATMAPEIERITNTFLSNPAKIEVARAATTNVNIKQGVVIFKASAKLKEAAEKRALLRALINAEGEACSNAIIFCNRKADVDVVAKSLNKYGYDAAPIHGDLEQSHRTRTLESFRDNKLRFLVASDVAARGLDIPAVTHVFNFDVPSHAEDYVHRIGRTGRAGRSGVAIMICAGRDEKNLEDVERLVQTTIPRLDNPLGVTAPVPAAETAATDDAPKRTRTRSRRSGERPAQDVPAPVAEAAAPVAPPAQAPTPEPVAKPAASQQEQRAPREQHKPREEQARPRYQDRRDNGPRIVGMGDDTPSFIAKSFEERAKG